MNNYRFIANRPLANSNVPSTVHARVRACVRACVRARALVSESAECAFSAENPSANKLQAVPPSHARSIVIAKHRRRNETRGTSRSRFLIKPRILSPATSDAAPAGPPVAGDPSRLHSRSSSASISRQRSIVGLPDRAFVAEHLREQTTQRCALPFPLSLSLSYDGAR
jgi:hypothetical protein